MNDRQLQFIAHVIALASNLSHNQRIKLEYEIIETYKGLEGE